MKKISKIAAALLAGTALASAAVGMGNTGNGNGDPFADMERVFRMQMQQMQQMQKQMDRLFQNFEQNFQGPALIKTPILVHSSGVLSSGFQDKGDHYELAIKVNDLKNSKVNISTENNMLTIEVSANKKVEKQQGNYGKIISYTNSSSVQSFTLPSDADPATIQASQKDNTITVIIRKKKSAKVIPIKKESGQTAPSAQPSSNAGKPETPKAQ